jgi:hypothetical protein
LLLVAACGDTTQPRDLHQGGSITLPAPCGYTVKTHDGASRPQAAQNRFGADPTPRFVHLNVAHDPSTSIAILWRTNDETTLATTVQYGENGKTDRSAVGFTFVYDTGDNQEVRIHETHLCGLQPDTQYTYRVGGGSAFSPVATFRTAPDRKLSPDAEVTVLVAGDTRDSLSTWGQVMSTAFALQQPDLVLFSGDMILLGPVQDDWDQWFGAVSAQLPSVPMMVAHGNHEVNGVNWFSQFAMPGDEQNFAVDFGPVHLTVANDTPPDAAELTTTIAQTLDQNLAGGDGAPWSVEMNHKTMWSAAMSRHATDTTTVRAALQPIIDAHQVDLVLNGHDHDYERTKPMRGATAGSGTTYVRFGSAGASLDPSGSDYWTAKSESTYSFGILRARVGVMQLTAYRSDGSMLDSLTLTK